jgi:hypothetical protein
VIKTLIRTFAWNFTIKFFIFQHRGTGDDFILNSRRFHQSQQQQQQQTIAEVEEMDDSKVEREEIKSGRGKWSWSQSFFCTFPVYLNLLNKHSNLSTF